MSVKILEPCTFIDDSFIDLDKWCITVDIGSEIIDIDEWITNIDKTIVDISVMHYCIH